MANKTANGQSLSGQHTLTIAACPPDDILDANIIGWVRCATVVQYNEGDGWYRRALGDCADMGIRYARRTEVVCAIVAVLSPSTRWYVNVMMAEAFLHAAYNGLPKPNMRLDGKLMNGYSANHAKAWAMANGGDISTYLRGPKVERFYAALMGVDNDATIDIWAVRAACNDMSLNGPGASYSKVAASYRRVAEDLGMYIHDLQAIVWSSVRGSGK